jgi:hypothetical protein
MPQESNNDELQTTPLLQLDAPLHGDAYSSSCSSLQPQLQKWWSARPVFPAFPASPLLSSCCRLLYVIGIAASLVLLVLSVALAMVLLLTPLLDDALDPQLELRFFLTSLPAAEAACLSRPRSSAVISLSSLPARLPHIDRTLKSLLAQTHCPQAIHLWLPKSNARLGGAAYELTGELQGYVAASRIVQVHREFVDIGPASKLVPLLLSAASLQLSPQQSVVVLDDDVLYSELMLQQYDCYDALLPDAAIGFWGGTLTDPLLQPDKEVEGWQGRHLLAPKQVDILFGTASFRVKPAFFNLTAIAAFPIPAPSAARYEDDLYFSGMLRLQAVRRYVVPIDRRQLVQFDTLLVERQSLMNTVNWDGNNFHTMLGWYRQCKASSSSSSDIGEDRLQEMGRQCAMH